MAVKGKVWKLAPGPRQHLDAADVQHAWVNRMGRRALGLGAAGVGLFTDAGARVVSWEQVVAIEVPSDREVALVVQSSEDPIEFTFARAEDQSEFLAEMPRDVHDRLLSADRLSELRSEARGSRASAYDTLMNLLQFGLIAQVVGGVAIGVTEDVGLAIGWVLVAGGSMATLTAIIGIGVRLGIKAASEG